MKDRQPSPGKEGLMKHTPCDASGVPTGAPAYYAKVDMADSPLEIGTSFSKANILSDTTAALINTLVGSTPSTPDAALSAITGKTQTLYNGRVQIATGSYTGTGTYGDSNKNTLEFPFEPKLVLVFPSGGSFAVFAHGSSYGNASAGNFNGNPGANTHVTFTEKKVSWYSAPSGGDVYGPPEQCNWSETTYRYVALG